MNTNKSALIILDGWGHGKIPEVDAIAQARTPYMDTMYQDFPNAELVTYGEQVGLPEGQMGNSEVGHLNIGAGRIVFQELARINNAISDGTLSQEKEVQKVSEYARSASKRIHLMGLVSDGGVHSHINHLKALIDIYNQDGIEVFIHAFLDGRDTDPENGAEYIKDLQASINGTNATIATVVGRYYAMDRDKRWERVKKAYDLLVHGEGLQVNDVNEVLLQKYKEGVTDEFMEPLLIHPEGLLQEGDAVFFFNFRTDRPRELTYVLSQCDMPEFDMKKISLHFTTMTNYDETFDGVHVVFSKENLKNTIGEVIEKSGRTQLHMAETEKYPHVTFFLNGGEEQPFDHENRIVVPSPKVATYDLQPEMSAEGVTQNLIQQIKEASPDFVCVNYANTDMVGHTGIMEAAIKAVEKVDDCMSRVVPQLLKLGYHTLIIADHGNSDIMKHPDGSPHTAHTTNPVPIIYVSPSAHEYAVIDGKLGDVAPTLLSLMNLEIPSEMTGQILIHKKN